MNRIICILLLFVAFSATDMIVLINAQQIVRTDTIVTTEVVKRTEIINHIEEVVFIDTIYDSKGSKKVVRRDSVVSIPVLPSEILSRPSLKERPVNYESEIDDTPGVKVIETHETAPIDGGEAIETKLETPKVELVDVISTDTDMECSLPKELPTAVKDGKYIWVPDSMAGEVKILLAGHSRLVDNEARIDHNEKVTFRGDTIPMVLRDRNLGRYNRGLFNYLYIPKGIWQLGITASYGEFSTEDLELFDLISDINFHGKIFSIRPYFSYFLGNNISVGMRLGYSYGRANVDSFNVDIDNDMSFNLHDIMYRSESYTAAFTFNQYFGITRRGRFGIFNEVELALSGGNTDFIRPYNSELKQTHTTTMQAALNFSPGLSVFIMEQVSFNVSFGVFGFSLKNEKQTVDGEKMGSRFTSGANFRFNIFNINFGIAVNL